MKGASLMQLDQQHLVDMAGLILEEAETRFSEYGAKDDFFAENDAHYGEPT